MKILIIIGPALGTINHALALSNLLRENGHEIIWLTGLEAQFHLEKMKSPYEIYYSEAHDLKFKANNPGGLPHFVYAARYDYLKKSTEKEIKIIAKVKPDLMITKHHYSVTISSRVFGIPFAYYCTDGVEYKFKERNPHNRWENEQGIEDYLKICQELGLICERAVYATDYLFSPFFNIIRGVPLVFYLTKNEALDLKNSNSIFAGLLTYDGPNSQVSNNILDKISPEFPLIYITFGTHYYEKERISIILNALIDFKGYIIISTGYFDPHDFNSNSQNVIFVKYIPNNQIIRIANIIIHHAGSGTTLTSFSYGVPQIVIPNNPNYSGQIYFANTIERNKCGKHIAFKDLTSERIKSEIQEVLLKSDYKKNAEKIKIQICEQDLICNKNLLIKLCELEKNIKTT
jgi:UDP:flavonoid glycosyltransferase YjiC (YdhE family)